ncbi:MAG: TonB C-terminal domain-containing protein [Massilia sp.]
MTIAIAVSVLLHAALLAVRFVAPDAFKFEPVDPGLEVILVNAKHDRAPLKAAAIAQANLDGGGNADAGRAKSPLPDLKRNENGDSMKAAERRIAELVEAQQNLLTRARDSQFHASRVTDKDKPDPSRTGQDDLETAKAIARQAAEIAQVIEDQNKRPRKTYITPSTQQAGYAMYYMAMQKKIEELGTLDFPQKNGRKLYGELILYIPVFQDGSIYTKEGGIRVEKSSGNADLDKAAIAIVRRSAPFGNFPRNMLSSDKDDLWVVFTRFTFNTKDKMQMQLRGDGK